MQHMTAVGSHVRPTLTNTHLVNLPIEQDAGYPLGPVTKIWFSCHWNPPFKEDFSYHLGWLSVTVRPLFQVRRHSPTLQFRVELRFDHQTVADLSQFCCKAV